MACGRSKQRDIARPHLEQFLPGPSRFQPAQQHPRCMVIATTGEAAMPASCGRGQGLFCSSGDGRHRGRRCVGRIAWVGASPYQGLASCAWVLTIGGGKAGEAAGISRFWPFCGCPHVLDGQGLRGDGAESFDQRLGGADESYDTPGLCRQDAPIPVDRWGMPGFRIASKDRHPPTSARAARRGFRESAQARP